MPGYNHAMNAPGPTRPERGNPYPPGGPAIQPRITAAAASTAAYTEADVRQYLAAHPMLPEPEKHFVWQRVPAWVVTFMGVNLSSRGGDAVAVNHEVNFVIDARTGEYLQLF